VRITAKEKEAIADLQRLAKKWPKTLKLFSWSGNLTVVKPGNGRTFGQAVLTHIDIPNDGGDPDMTDEAF
jgi:hypothetical protein